MSADEHMFKDMSLSSFDFALYHLVRRQDLHNLNEYANVSLEPATSYSLQVLPPFMFITSSKFRSGSGSGPCFFFFNFFQSR